AVVDDLSQIPCHQNKKPFPVVAFTNEACAQIARVRPDPAMPFRSFDCRFPHCLSPFPRCQKRSGMACTPACRSLDLRSRFMSSLTAFSVPGSEPLRIVELPDV